MLAATQKVSLGRHQALSKAISSGSGPVREVLQSWEKIYVAFILKRFDKFSRGGGDWPKLKPGTIRAKGSSAILVDKRYLRMGLATGIRSTSHSGARIVFAFTSRSLHPTAKMPIAELATIHNEGEGIVPKRQILVRPDQQTVKQLLAMAGRRLSGYLRG